MLDLIGKKIGRLTVLGLSEPKLEGGRLRECFMCKCDCGNFISVLGYSLNRKTRPTSSCGCVAKEKRTTHGMAGGKNHKGQHRLYSIYRGLYSRCNNSSNPNYKNYGGRGIVNGRPYFELFYNDMIDSYNEHVKKYGEKNTSLDRINVHGNYCKENCKRSTRKEQANNTTRNRICTYKGETHTLQERLDLLGVPRSSI